MLQAHSSALRAIDAELARAATIPLTWYDVLLERRGDDKRVVWAMITGDGVAALRRTAPLCLRGIEAHFSAYLTDEEKSVVAAALTRVSRQGAGPAG